VALAAPNSNLTSPPTAGSGTLFGQTVSHYRISVTERLVDVVSELLCVGHAQVQHCGFEALVAEPMPNGANWDAVFVPPCRTGFAEPMEIPVLTLPRTGIPANGVARQ
jgi:hypothetical protein